MKISIKDITSLPDQSKKFTGAIDICDFSYLGSDFSINHIEPFDVVLSMIGSGKLHITFDTKCSILGQCDRCLGDVTFEIPVSADETVEVSEGQVVTDDDIGMPCKYAPFLFPSGGK